MSGSEPKACVNRACEWNNGKGGCRLFPGDFGWLTCKHCMEPTKKQKTTKKESK